MDALTSLMRAVVASTVSSPWLIAVAVGIAMTALALGAMRTTSGLLNPMRRRLGALRERDVEVASADRQHGRASAVWEKLGPRREGQRARLREKLIHAGFRSRDAIGWFYAFKLVVAVLLPAAMFSLVWAAPEFREAGPVVPLIVGVSLLIGLLLPDAFLDRRIEARKTLLMEGLPDALDLLVACTEAGLGLNAALERVVEQLPASHPELARELGMVNAEIRAGVDRSVALRNLAERTALDDIRGLVSLITHSARLGTGIAGTLRIYAEEFRDRRMQRAEELGGKVGTKLIFPLIFCLWPAFFVVVIGPAVINIIKVFSGNAL